MAHINKVLIGIQARSGSQRFPKKIFHKIDGKMILQHVIDSAQSCARYMNKHSAKTNIFIDVAVLCPMQDEITQVFGKQINIIEGPEHDVLDRYNIALDKTKADYMVRITSDCVLLPAFLITKHIKTAIMNEYDYVSNVDEGLRSSPDGYDVEVISSALLKWVHQEAKNPFDREHVTTKIRSDWPSWAKVGFVLGFLDISGIKISLDTTEDLKLIEKMYFDISGKYSRAVSKYKTKNVHRI